MIVIVKDGYPAAIVLMRIFLYRLCLHTDNICICCCDTLSNKLSKIYISDR